MKILNISPGLLFFALLFSACEDPIDMDIKQGNQALIVEGWLTNKAEKHYVKLYLTKTLDDKNAYEPVTGATIDLSDDAGNSEVLKEVSAGKYEISSIRGIEGRTYTLVIEAPQGNYQAVSRMPRLSMAPDSLTFKFEEKSIVYDEEGYYPYIYGQELPGKGDYIQVKLFKNGRYLNHPEDINIFSDEFVDGSYINNTELEVDSAFARGDVVKAEVWSLTEEAYHFWVDMQTQLRNGGVFASPLTNTRTNIRKLNPEAKNVNGFFGTSLVGTTEAKVK